MTLGEIVLGAFDLATEFARKRVRKEAGIVDDPRVTREDFEQAVIALRFDMMGLTLAQIDAASEAHRERMAELQRRLDAERAAGNVPNVTIVQPCPQWRTGCVGYQGHPGDHGVDAPRMPPDPDDWDDSEG